MARLSNGARWGVIIGGYVGAKFLNGVARNSPELAPWIWPLLVVYLVFVLLTWFAYPLFNLLLRFNKFGWYALTPDARAASNWFGGCLALLVGSLVLFFAWDVGIAILVAGFAIGMALPLVTIYQCDVGWPRQAMTAYAAGLALVGAGALAGAAFGQDWGQGLMGFFLLGFIATPWLANYLMGATARK